MQWGDPIFIKDVHKLRSNGGELVTLPVVEFKVLDLLLLLLFNLVTHPPNEALTVLSLAELFNMLKELLVFLVTFRHVLSE